MTSAQEKVFEELLLHAGDSAEAEAKFLRVLSNRRILVILRQPAGPGPAAPERNLVQWQRETDGTTFVPAFTQASHLSFALPSPAQCVEVPMRVLLAAGGAQRYIINPLSKPSFEMKVAQLALLRTGKDLMPSVIIDRCTDLLRCHIARDVSHLRAYVVVPGTLCKGVKLCFQIDPRLRAEPRGA